MKAHIKPSALAGNKQKRQVRELVREELRRQAGANMRRTFKLFCLCLNEKYGFGKDRLDRLIASVSELAEQHERDEVFWTHVDQRIGQMGLTFDKENYEEMDA